jgi:hypothetical protein
MLRTSVPVFEPELVAFLESGCSTIVGLVTGSGEPFATRGWGIRVLPGEPEQLRLLVGAGPMAAAGRTPGDGTTFAIAVTGADVRTLRSVQLKGTAHDLEPVTDADLACSARYCAEFFADVEDADDVSPALMQRLVPADLLACTVEVAEAYDQTPGPGAGAALAAGRT